MLFDIINDICKKYNVEELATAMISTIKEVKYNNVPIRLRLYTNESNYNTMRDKYNKKGNCFTVLYNGNVYNYMYKNVKSSSKDYDSIFVGVEFTVTSFNRANVLEKIKIGNTNEDYVYVYTDSRSPKCLRIGFIRSWDIKSVKCFNSNTTNVF